MKKQFKLIGGYHHGEAVQVPETVELVQTTDFLDSTEAESVQIETYVRRKLSGEQFPDGFECFAVSTDDPTETEALALLHLNE